MEYKILDKITFPHQVKEMNDTQLKQLCAEIRDCLIETVSKNGGHLASNLGTVELTVALHRVFNSPEDAIIFDVGHQSYTHKLLTGRYPRFDTLRKEEGISGFMRPDESEHDPFITGHSSNSVSAAYGIYKAKELSGKTGTAIAVIGDGALTGGLAFEGLNNAGSSKSNFIVVLNDNKMSISKNVGSLARYLNRIRSKTSYHSFKDKFGKFLVAIPFIGNFLHRKVISSKIMIKNAIYHSNIFEGLGFNYLGPVDGHNIAEVENILAIAKNQKRPTIVHVVTVKGKGYSFAENQPGNYHGVSAFDTNIGAVKKSAITYSGVAAKTICKMAEKDSKICAITAAMTDGTELCEFSNTYKKRFFDVGIAEEHAVTFAAGLAKGGMKPYFVVYSSFLQRAYDQIVHDTAIAGLPVRFCIDRAGIVGEDGETHQGIFDVSFLTSVPGITVYSPASYTELSNTLRKTDDFKTPVAVRYPRGCEIGAFSFEYTGNDYDIFFGDNENVIITYGRISYNAFSAAQKQESTAFIKLNKIYPVSDDFIEKIFSYKNVYIFEEGIKSGGIAEKISAILCEKGFKGNISVYAINNDFIPCGATEKILDDLNLSENAMLKIIGGK